MNPSSARRIGRRIGMVGIAAAAVVATLTGCSTKAQSGSNGQYGFDEAAQSKGSTITVWVDATRAPAVKAFEQANPSIKVKTVTYDGSSNGSNSFKTKMGLFDRSGSGWPDVVFSSQNNDASWASQKTAGKQPFAAVLDKGLVPQSTLSNFTKGSLDVCTVDGKVYCLRNDLAQNVLWYNKTLLTKFGYSLPTTWEEYQQLGAKVAKDHPGYIIGSVGDPWPEIYMAGSKCGANEVTGARTMSVDTESTECKRATDLIDAGVANKSLSTLSVFSPDFVKKYSGKVLMMPGPVWFSGAIFNNAQSLNVPKGQLGVANPLPWGSDQAVTGNVGGGTWFISSHSKNLAAATKFAQYVTTADAYQVDQAPGYPAYAPAATKWLAKQSSSGYYATDLSAVTTAAGEVWSGWGSPAFSQEAIWAKVMSPLITSGKSTTSNLAAWGTEIKNQAQVNGYTVK
ncbi:ABC transporter substrate-binding protein [Amnibacterium kyonggiense]|uniref:Multiple sugar transport system substrate-binding protein n=2 Tax=Amnibacterium kyonggiense TaxID=595671 RepID=A0A4R7FQD2_9MICO|nr:multiple sugar transport system substrate-binding protein [Amnibacterium kyonggiense]